MPQQNALPVHTALVLCSVVLGGEGLAAGLAGVRLLTGVDTVVQRQFGRQVKLAWTQLTAVLGGQGRVLVAAAAVQVEGVDGACLVAAQAALVFFFSCEWLASRWASILER